MTDIELTRACAEAMGLTVHFHRGRFSFYADSAKHYYDPLHDKAQCFEMVERFRLHVCPGIAWAVWPDGRGPENAHDADDPDLPRAVVQCVAAMHAARK